MDFRFEHGSCHIFSGPSGSGKTQRVAEILYNLPELIKGGDRIKNVVICYNTWQPIYEELKHRGIVNKFVQKSPTVEDFIQLTKPYVNHGGSLCVIDDFMSQIGPDMQEIITVHSRHHNTTTFLLFQSLFPPAKAYRQISLNARYLHCFRAPRDNYQIEYLFRQMSPKNYKWIVEAYNDCVKDMYSPFLIDMSPSMDEKYRFRARCLPREFPLVLYVQKGTII